MLEKVKKTMNKDKLRLFLHNLRDEIVNDFESLETNKHFEKKPWEHKNGKGGGVMSVLRGDVFEKAAVNWSELSGDEFPLAKEALGPFYATGLSLITHMKNPYAPTAHMNIRYIETKENFWFGGGYDLTPMGYPFEEDSRSFHQAAKDTLAPFGKELYGDFMQAAKEYFFLPHRNKERGIGGIFFDHYNSGKFNDDYQMWREVGQSFSPALMPILKKRIKMPYGKEEKEEQLRLRGHYVEFNLLYDRGSKFGFQSGGNTEAILCSMPPEVKW